MERDYLSQQKSMFGRVSAWAVFGLSMFYVITTGLGFLSLEKPTDTIGDPYYTIMELLIMLMASLILVSMVAVHAYASPERKVFATAALIFTAFMVIITICVHFVILTVGRSLETSGLDWPRFIFSFNWPSICYALDILAWDWFFALSMLFCAPIFRSGKLEIVVRTLMVVSGALCLVGLIGVPLQNMQVRNIGIIGYGLLAPFIFLLIGFVFKNNKKGNIDHEQNI